MRQSTLFTKTRREAPKNEAAKNAILLIKAGFINKEMAGVYSFLPLGLRVIDRLVRIIRQEMKALNAQELSLSALQNPEIWQTTGRWSDQAVDVWFKTALKNKTALGLGFTHEEPVVNLMRGEVNSYRDLPILVYQIQTKFRNETRVKNGLLRCREFLMKDLYALHHREEDFSHFYEQIQNSYQKIFQRLGLGDRTFLTFASGGSFSKFSLEFQTICESGEDTIYLQPTKKRAINAEIMNETTLKNSGLEKEELVPHRAVETANLFNLGTRFSSALGLIFKDEKGRDNPVWLSSYGLGVSRLMGVIAEIFNDDRGLIWPKAVAPYPVHLIVLKPEVSGVREAADTLYQKMLKGDLEPLFDDRPLHAGEKLADSDLIGLPFRIIISEKTLAQKKLELFLRGNGQTKFLSENQLINFLKQQHVK